MKKSFTSSPLFKPFLITLLIFSSVLLFEQPRRAFHEVAKQIHETGSSYFPHGSTTVDEVEDDLRIGVDGHVATPSPTSDASHVAVSPSPSPNNDFAALSALCERTKWTPNLWLFCSGGCGPNHTSFCGGLNNARNRVSTCLRWAIDAGVTGVIIDTITERDEDHLLNTGFKAECPEEWFDLGATKNVLANHCPRMQLHTCKGLDALPVPVDAARVWAPEMRNFLQPNYHLGSFREFVHAGLPEHGFEPANETSPVVVLYGDLFIGWDYAASEELSTVREDLFKAVPYNKKLLALGDAILGTPELVGGEFIAVHLRGEGDWPSEFGTAKDQMDRYKERIFNITETMPFANDVRTVYVSCGDKSAVQTFREMVEPEGYVVHDKWSLATLHPDMKELVKVEEIEFDRKGIVEYQVMVHARYWLGVSMSSMSLLVAYARTVNDERDFFDKYVFPNSQKQGLLRQYAGLEVKGNGYTNLLLVSGADIMASFP